MINADSPGQGASIADKIAITIAVGAFALALCLTVWGALQFRSTSQELANLGAFYGGTVAPLVSMAVLAMLYLAYHEQRRQVSSERRQVELQEKQIAEARERDAREAFEGKFYHLLTILREVVNTMQTRPAGPNGAQYRGVDSFHSAVNEVAGRFLEDLRRRWEPGKPASSLQDYVEALEAAVGASCFMGGCDFGHYVHTLRFLLEHLNSTIPTERAKYALLVRSQMTADEIALAYLVGPTSFGLDLKPLLETHRMLRHVRVDERLKGVRALYESAAFSL